MKVNLDARRRRLTTIEETYEIEAATLQEAVNMIEDCDVDPDSTEICWEDTRELSTEENNGESTLKIYTYEDKQVYP